MDDADTLALALQYAQDALLKLRRRLATVRKRHSGQDQLQQLSVVSVVKRQLPNHLNIILYRLMVNKFVVPPEGTDAPTLLHDKSPWVHYTHYSIQIVTGVEVVVENVLPKVRKMFR